MCEPAFTPSERIRLETTRPEGKAPTLVPRRSVEGSREARGREPPLGALSPSRRRGSRARAVGITVRSCLGAGEGFQGSLLLDLAEKPKEVCLAARGRCGREPGTAGRGARRSRTFPPQCFGAGFLLILPGSLTRMLGNIESDLQLAILPPPPCPQHRELILSHLNPPLPKELQQKLN